ncbi:MAG: hypothetical protein ABJB66_20585, partial [Gemmatimonadaceae bacterium]
MTNAIELTTPPKKPVWYARSGVVLSLLGVLVLISALVTRSRVTGREGDPRLTTTSADPLGAKMLFELAGKLGFKTERAESWNMPDSASTILGVLDPVVPLNKKEVHNILEFVRTGGALLIVLGNGTGVLSDSLSINSDNTGGSIQASSSFGRDCGKSRTIFGQGLWFGSTASLYGLNGRAID